MSGLVPIIRPKASLTLLFPVTGGSTDELPAPLLPGLFFFPPIPGLRLIGAGFPVARRGEPVREAGLFRPYSDAPDRLDSFSIRDRSSRNNSRDF
jgi:hypothetical protein